MFFATTGIHGPAFCTSKMERQPVIYWITVPTFFSVRPTFGDDRKAHNERFILQVARSPRCVRCLSERSLRMPVAVVCLR